MLEEQEERCPWHPNAVPMLVTVGATQSAQSDYPTRLIQQWRCPVCR
jgi:hypothetical protein